MKIRIEELMEQIKLALGDEFEADVKVEQNAVVLDFNGEQKFELTVKEI
ncbi:MAG: hypothetical protein IJD54_04830 [Clostridia bacterium]|nr:hypothetical protein [Clostridia bacterium]